MQSVRHWVLGSRALPWVVSFSIALAWAGCGGASQSPDGAPPSGGGGGPTDAAQSLDGAEPTPLPERPAFVLEAKGGFSPWSSVRYELRWVTDRPMLSHERFYYGGFDDEVPPRTAFLDADQLDALVRDLEGCGFASVGDPVRTDRTDADRRQAETSDGATDRWRWRWTLLRGEGDARAEASGVQERRLEPERAADAACIAAIERAVERHTEPIPFQQVYVADSERGYLDVATAPPARLHVDGIDLGVTTPVWRVPLPAGEHELRLVVEEEGIDQTYDVKIEPGVTTRFELDLR